MTALLSTSGLGKTFATRAGPVRVLQEIHMEVKPGCFTLLTGPSGSGKTTFLHLIGFLTPPTEGVIRFDGREVPTADRSARVRIRRQEVGMVFQHSGLLPRRTVLQNVMFRDRYRGTPASASREEALEVLKQVGLEAVAHRRAGVLSGGESQRVAVARALMGRPRLLLADEPTGNLDGDNAARIVDLLSGIAGRGTAVVMVTHDLSWRDLADEEYRFVQGHVERRI
jgi:putative ABC transport system ATP-binding protein